MENHLFGSVLVMEELQNPSTLLVEIKPELTLLQADVIVGKCRRWADFACRRLTAHLSFK